MIEHVSDTIKKFDGNYRFLSNFWPCDVYGWPTVEHAYQASKTQNLGERQLIMQCETPGKAKRLGDKVTLRLDWNHVKLHIMIGLIDMKFSPVNQMLLDLLLETGEAKLVEGNDWGDVYWGVSSGIGSNHLGKILMYRRAQLRGT